jgi:hypothetical protein
MLLGEFNKVTSLMESAVDLSVEPIGSRQNVYVTQGESINMGGEHYGRTSFGARAPRIVEHQKLIATPFTIENQSGETVNIVLDYDRYMMEDTIQTGVFSRTLVNRPVSGRLYNPDENGYVTKVEIPSEGQRTFWVIHYYEETLETQELDLKGEFTAHMAFGVEFQD